MAKRPLSDDDYEGDEYDPKVARKSSKKAGGHKVSRKKTRNDDSVDDYDDEKTPEPLCGALLDWYADVHESRGMPWRKPYDPSFGPEERGQRAYEVWISEVMLQQTQVATVIPYYNKWMAKFPTIKDLANSDIETVNSLWKGLGYYSRAARLLSGAQKAVKEFKGRLPDNAKDMEAKIPGIGRYSAGAICSIAYNQCVPVLDGNVHRLLSRVLALHAPPKSKQTLDVLWNAATAMVESTQRPGDLNQAMIELGSTVCKVREPGCATCPIKSWCKAYELSQAKGKTDAVRNESEVPDIEELCTLCEPMLLSEGALNLITAFPMRAERKKAREELDIVNIVEWYAADDRDRWFLIVQRPEKGLLAGLHEFPTEPNVSSNISALEMTKVPHRLLSRLLKSRLEPYVPNTKKLKARHTSDDEVTGTSLRIVKIKPAGDVIHVFSHIKKTYRIQWVVLRGGGSEPPQLETRAQKQGTSKLDRPKGKAGKRRQNADEQEDEVESPGRVEAKWALLDEVANANIGTGVLKVWNQAKALWENE